MTSNLSRKIWKILLKNRPTRVIYYYLKEFIKLIKRSAADTKYNSQ